MRSEKGHGLGTHLERGMFQKGDGAGTKLGDGVMPVQAGQPLPDTQALRPGVRQGQHVPALADLREHGHVGLRAGFLQGLILLLRGGEHAVDHGGDERELGDGLPVGWRALVRHGF